MTKRVAIIQSNYIPWKGYFDIIQSVDEFVLLDDVQYTRRDWRNRNLIKTPNGIKWLSIPVQVKGNYFIQIKDVLTSDDLWRADHWNAIIEAYRKCPYFSTYQDRFESIYLGDSERALSQINFKFINLINEILNIKTPIRWAMEFDSSAEKSERLFHICRSLQADEYVSGPAAKDYLNVSLFEENNMKVRWADYSNYPVYNQQFPPFEPKVSIIDLIFNEGPNAHNYLKNVL